MFITQTEVEILSLLPVLCAACFAAPSWGADKGKAYFVPEDLIFESNHHCMALAIASLLCIFFGKDPPLPDPKAVYNPVDSQERIDYSVRLLRAMCTEYSYISAQILLTMKHTSILAAHQRAESQSSDANQQSLFDERNYLDRPLNAMLLQVESFLSYLPPGVIDHSELESALPYCLIHQSLMDISLGKVYPVQTVERFKHSTWTETVQDVE